VYFDASTFKNGACDSLPGGGPPRLSDAGGPIMMSSSRHLVAELGGTLCRQRLRSAIATARLAFS